VGHILRKTESILRPMYKHKHKLTADTAVLVYSAKKLARAGITLEELNTAIQQAITAHQRERNRVHVAVDMGSLSRIREEAQDTQEKLTVEEESVGSLEIIKSPLTPLPVEISLDTSTFENYSSIWDAFFTSLTSIEKEALSVLLQENASIKAFAAAQGVMLEVLIEGINEKALNTIGDNLLEMDEDVILYDDYREYIKLGCAYAKQ
jgi:hypothetical protein